MRILKETSLFKLRFTNKHSLKRNPITAESPTKKQIPNEKEKVMNIYNVYIL